MRILFAITLGEVGGAQEHLRILASALAKRGHTLGVVTQEPSELSERVRRSGIEVYDWPSITRNPHPAKDLAARRELRESVSAFAPDVLHLYSSKAGTVGRGLLHRPEGVTVFTCHHAPYGPGRRWSHRVIGRIVDQVTLRRVDGIISDGARDMPLLRKLAPAVPIRLIRNATTYAHPPDGAAPNRTALWVARMQHPKDPVLLVRAWAKVVEEIPDARLIMCGAGPLLAEVQGAAALSRASANIEVLGRVDDLAEQRARASVFILATRVEGGITMATLEAMGNGLVPIVSDAGDAFLIDHAHAGVVIRPRSPSALASAVVNLLRRPDDLAAMRQRAIRFAREHWTADDLVEATESFYRKLLGSGGPTVR